LELIDKCLKKEGDYKEDLRVHLNAVLAHEPEEEEWTLLCDFEEEEWVFL